MRLPTAAATKDGSGAPVGLCIYIYIYIYICMYVCMFMYIHIYVYTHIYIYIYMYVHIYIYIYEEFIRLARDLAGSNYINYLYIASNNRCECNLRYFEPA